MVTWTTDIILNPRCSRTMNLDMTSSNRLGLGITMFPVAAKATQISMALAAAWPSDTNMTTSGRTRSWASVWAFLSTRATDINIDPSCSRTTEPDMLLSRRLDLYVNMAPAGNTGDSDQQGSNGSVTLRHQHGFGWYAGPRNPHSLRW